MKKQSDNENVSENYILNTDTILASGERRGMPDDNDEETVATSNVTVINDERSNTRTNDGKYM